MSEKANPSALAGTPTRRQVIAGAAIAFGGLAAGSDLSADFPQQTMKEPPGKPENYARTFLHQEIDVKASAQRIYAVLLDSKQFAAFSGMPAEIDSKAGGALSLFGGLVVARNVELIPGRRIVQAWRPESWDKGVYSVVRFEFKEQGSETRIVLDHTGFPQGKFDGLDSGWHERYWEPLKKFLA